MPTDHVHTETVGAVARPGVESGSGLTHPDKVRMDALEGMHWDQDTNLMFLLVLKGHGWRAAIDAVLKHIREKQARAALGRKDAEGEKK